MGDTSVADRTNGMDTRGLLNDWLPPEADFPASVDTFAKCDTSNELSSRAVSPATYGPPIEKKIYIPRADTKIELLQQWECVVLRPEQSGYVECEMHDLHDDKGVEEFATISVDEFSESDRILLTEGTVFYWSVGMETNKFGTIKRYSETRVRRMPPLSKGLQRELSQRAKDIRESLQTPE